MSTAYIYNAFGQYEQDEKLEKGIKLRFAGVDFWLPYRRVTPIPDFTFREVDEPATAEAGEQGEGYVVYRTVQIPGNRIAVELTEKQIPYPNKDRGIVIVAPNAANRRNTYSKVRCGVAEDGTVLMNEVQDVGITPEQAQIAEQTTLEYKKNRIQEYIQGKRERAGGGQGLMFPTGMVKVFMSELNVRDVDDIDRMMGTPAQTEPAPVKTIIDPDLREALLAQLRAELGLTTAPAKAAKLDLEDFKPEPAAPSPEEKEEALI